MLQDIFFIIRKELKYQLRSRETLLWVFVMPIGFFYFIGTVTSGFGPGGGGARADQLALIRGSDAGFLADQLKRRLEDRNFVVTEVDAEVETQAERRLVVPERFTERVLQGKQASLRLIDENKGITGDYTQMRVARAVYSLLADVVVGGELGKSASPESFEELDRMPRQIQVDVTSAGRRKHIPTGFEQAIPGIMVMFTLMVMATSGAVLLVIERNQGLLSRLASTPIKRFSVTAGKWGGKLALGLIQIAFAMLTGRYLFSMDWGPQLPSVGLLMIAYAAFMASLGLVLGNLVKTEGQAVAIGVVSANSLAALGGCWWPIEITPPWMQKASLLLPTGWAMDGLHKLISFGAPASSVLPHISAMVVGTAVFLLIASRIFRYQ